MKYDTQNDAVIDVNVKARAYALLAVSVVMLVATILMACSRPEHVSEPVPVVKVDFSRADEVMQRYGADLMVQDPFCADWRMETLDGRIVGYLITGGGE